MNHSPRVSVIIPSYNYADYLPECIGSLIRQSFGDWEAIIVDDGSSDNTPQVGAALESEHPGKVRFFRIENSGVAAARNYGIEQSRGEYLLPLDADDLLVPHAIDRFVTALSNHPDCGYAYSALETYQCLPGEGREWLPGPYFLQWLTHENNAACTALWRRDLWDQGVRYHELIHEDWDLWLQIVSRGKSGVYIPEPLLRYRMHPDGRHSTNKHHYFLAFFEEVSRHPALYPAALGETAKEVLLNVPECIGKPSFVFLLPAGRPSGEREAVEAIARVFVANGVFVAIVGDANTFPAIPGVARLHTGEQMDLLSMASRLGMLGERLTVFHAGSSHESRLLKSYDNVAVVLNMSGELDSVADVSICPKDGQVRYDVGAKGERTLGVQDLLQVLLLQGAQEPPYREADNAARAIQKQLLVEGVPPRESTAAVEKLKIAVTVDQFEPSKLERCLEALRGMNPKLVVFGRARDSFAELSELAASFDATISCALNIRPVWSRTLALNSWIKQTFVPGSDESLCVFDQSAVVSPEFFATYEHYRSRFADDVIFFSEAVREVPGKKSSPDEWRKHPSLEAGFPGEVKTACVVLPVAWLLRVGGWLEPLQSEEGMFVDVSYRARLDERPIVWFPAGTVLRQGGVVSGVREWIDYDHRVIDHWKANTEFVSAENTGGLQQGSALPGASVEPPDVALLEHAAEFSFAQAQVIASVRDDAERIGRLIDAGIQALQRSQVPVARALFEDAIVLKKDLLEAWVGLGHAILHSGGIQLAGHCAAVALDIAPQDARARELFQCIAQLLSAEA